MKVALPVLLRGVLPSGAVAGLVTALAVTLVSAVPAPAAAPHSRPVVETGADLGTGRWGGLPLAGRLVVLDPGHQLGNRNFPRQVERLVPAGGFRKPCNTTGTATNGGFPEATFAWDVALRVRARLQALGARVELTRHANSPRLWGPCVDVRGRAGNASPWGPADLKISIHADGSYAPGAHGFHVIAPADRRPWTHDIYHASWRLALTARAALLRQGFSTATYIAGGDGLDVRRDLATLNLSDIPTVMVELGNMRSPRDAATMTAAAGRERYARALAMAAERYLAAGWRPAEARPTTAARAGERLEHARAAADHVRE